MADGTATTPGTEGDKTTGAGDQGGPSGRPQRHARHPALFAGTGVILAALLAVVLLSVRSSGPSGGASAAGSPTLPGLTPATAGLLSLSLYPKRGAAAPDFRLTDQAGRPLTLSQFRGKAVVLSFNDDRCADVCTLLAEDVVRANQFMTPSDRARVAFVSVNVNPFFPQVAAVRQWSDDNDLGSTPNWFFGTGPTGDLEAVWKDYGVYVGPDPRTQTVTHSTLVEFIGADGTIRASADFGQNAVDVDPYAHGLAQAAVDLLPRSEQGPVAGPQASAGGGTGAGLGQQAPGFDLPVLGQKGRNLDLASVRGHPVVLNFWASSCQRCRAELGDLAQVASADPKVAFIGIDVADPSPGSASSLVAGAGVTYPVLADTGGKVAATYGVSGLPTTVYVDPDGRVSAVHPGALTAEQLRYTLGQFFPDDTPSD